jgi:S-DNA-T family DNA segregation ATPase FtsK/SpoIIIE
MQFLTGADVATGRPTVATGSGAPEVSLPPDVPASSEFAWAPPNLQRCLSHLSARTVAAPSDDTWLAATVTALRTALLSYSLQAKVIGSRLTPNAALVRFQGSDRLRTTDVEYRRNELLTTHRLNITSILAEPGQVLVSVARPERQVVSLVEVWKNRRRDRQELHSNETLVLGVREADGEPLHLSPG